MSLLKDSRGEDGIQGIKVCQGAPHVNQLLFTDNSNIFYKSDSNTKKKIQKILDIYGKAPAKRLIQK